MRKTISSDICDISVNTETFVIGLFDAIKCARASDASLDIKLSRSEVLYLADDIEKLSHVEIY